MATTAVLPAIGWLLFAALILFIVINGDGNGYSDGDATGGTPATTMTSPLPVLPDAMQRELDLVNSLVPLKKDPPAIMFWRPQKVGSSTVLGLLVSYGYRYNVLVRRKATMNSLCVAMAKGALDKFDAVPEGTFGRRGSSSSNNGMNKQATRHRLQLYVSKRMYGAGSPAVLRPDSAINERLADSQPYLISTSHQMCNLHPRIVQWRLPTVFHNRTIAAAHANVTTTARTTVHELFIVREPLARAVSVYYFWGELYKLHAAAGRGRKAPGAARAAVVAAASSSSAASTDRRNRRRRLRLRLGKAGGDAPIARGAVLQGNFAYHGNESTVPPLDIARAFAASVPYSAGMPAPSYTWSAFANSAAAAIAEVKTDRIMTIVTERLDESLLVASHYLGWSLADVVVTAPRKALSSHPKHTDWPAEAIADMDVYLRRTGEMALYKAANEKLDQRVQALQERGVNVTAQLGVLRALRSRVEALCLSEEYLERYRAHLQSQGYQRHHSNNKLRETADTYVDQGHCFSFNTDILFSYDVCGPCEAHALLLAVRKGLATTVQTAPVLKDLSKEITDGNVDLLKCPRS